MKKINLKLFDEKKTEPYFHLITLISFAIITISGLIFHEPWRDEAQAWLIARDLPFIKMIQQMGYEGTPALWHIILMPFAKSGAPYFTESIIHWIFIVTGVGLFLFHSPFSKITKILFTFSFYIAFEYALVARNYNLTLLFLFIIAALYKQRFEKSIIYALSVFLLFNTNLHSFFAAVAISFLFLFEASKSKKIFEPKIVTSLSLMGLGGILSAFQLFQRTSADISKNAFYPMKFFTAPINAIANSFIPRSDTFLIASIFVTLLFFIILIALIKKPKSLFFLVVACSWIFFIFSSVHPGMVRHHGLIMIFLIFTLWISVYEKEKDWLKIIQKLDFKIFKKTVTLTINSCLFISMLLSIYSYTDEYRYNFSGAKEIAEYLIKNDLVKNNTIVGHTSYACSAILPYLKNKKCWYADIESYGSFITWNDKFSTNKSITNDEALKRLKANFKNDDKLILILTKPLDDETNYKLIYKNSKPVFRRKDESFYLYKRVI